MNNIILLFSNIYVLYKYVDSGHLTSIDAKKKKMYVRIWRERKNNEKAPTRVRRIVKLKSTPDTPKRTARSARRTRPWKFLTEMSRRSPLRRGPGFGVVKHRSDAGRASGRRTRRMTSEKRRRRRPEFN